MTAVTDLAAWLDAQLAEDERVARAAVGTAAFQQQTGEWVYEYVPGEYGATPIVFAVADRGGKTQAANLETAWERDERGVHIARWDPARVLAECEAKRRIVELHRDEHECVTYPGGLAWLVQPDADDEAPSGTIVKHDPTLRLLALPYADRPDFPEEWR